uniref:Uncharacterized protein n=1 Tax=Plectus sambesii TaxID=2011161 RepID=A0A914WL33_9BILA
MSTLVQLLVILFALVFYNLPLCINGVLECYEYNVIAPPEKEEQAKPPDATCITSSSFCISYIIYRKIYKEVTNSEGISYIVKHNYNSEIAIRGECAFEESFPAQYCRNMTAEGDSCRLASDADDAFMWVSKRSVKNELVDETGLAAFCCCSSSRCNSQRSLLTYRPVKECYNYASVDVRHVTVDAFMKKESCSNSTYCASALIRQTLKNGSLVTKAYGTCNELQYQAVCDAIGDGCMYGYRLTEMFEEISEYFKSMPWNWEMMCCCRSELCNTAMAIIQMAGVNTCYRYEGLLDETTTKAMERERCPSDYCTSQIYTTTLTGDKNFLVAMNCADREFCDNLKEQCAFIGDDFAIKMERKMSATLTTKHVTKVTAKLHSLCCCKGDRCNDKETLWNLYSARLGPNAEGNKSIEIARHCLEYEVSLDDGSNVSRSLSTRKCSNASEYCMSQERQVTTLAFGKTKRWLVGSCADDQDEVKLCKRISNITSMNGTENSCFHNDGANLSELSNIFTADEEPDHQMVQLQTVCCCKGDNCNTIDRLPKYSNPTATVTTLNDTTTMTNSMAIGAWPGSVTLLTVNLICLLIW